MQLIRGHSPVNSDGGFAYQLVIATTKLLTACVLEPGALESSAIEPSVVALIHMRPDEFVDTTGIAVCTESFPKNFEISEAAIP